MEVCRKCKTEIQENDKFIEITSWSEVAGGKYHLSCYEKQKRNQLKFALWFIGILVILGIIFTIWCFKI